MRYLLDTNTISHALREPRGTTAKRISELPAVAVGTSVLVRAELRFGYLRVRSVRLEQLVEGFLATMRVAEWGDPCDRLYAELRAHLERRGKPIGQMDMLIAAHALALGAVLVTDNLREFSTVEGLAVENWVSR
jgi:tRNA(fMet)-specific endonuclease VapC